MGVEEVEPAGLKVVIHESEDTHDSTTGRVLTGAWLWDSAIQLAHFLTTRQLTNLTILELGASTGLPGLTAALLGATRVILTDLPPLLPSLRRNVLANDLEACVEVKVLDWRADLLDTAALGKLDVVLMSDVFYDPHEMESLGRLLRRVSGENTRVWAATEVRQSSGECLQALVTQGFHVTELEVTTRSLLHAKHQTALVAVYEHLIPAPEN
ncbi:putative lysine methyltransferase, S-adenosyl-L-methionine-dependent methyltransferase [Dioscorea sansibarensis]